MLLCIAYSPDAVILCYILQHLLHVIMTRKKGRSEISDFVNLRLCNCIHLCWIVFIFR